MTISEHTAKLLRDVYLGDNWTSSSLKQHVSDITYKEATTSYHFLNTIAKLVYHMDYYVIAAKGVLNGEPLTAKDKFSFDHPNFDSQAAWDNFLKGIFANAEELAILVEKLPEAKLLEDFSEGKYGSIYRNLHGIIEHLHYHLGQVVIIKKLIRSSDSKN
ncbi:hypothetical protein SAMN03097699_1166 [Flavobacteriaceae bacterium MAR_2010_188]|nr:hypothetical protein SAMN03097699_1166 [Flavobacteriaceae bacterium MAR_2010_188]